MNLCLILEYHTSLFVHFYANFSMMMVKVSRLGNFLISSDNDK